MLNDLIIRRNSSTKFLVYIITFVIGAVFLSYLLILHPHLEGAAIIIGVSMLLLFFFFMIIWLPKIWVKYADGMLHIYEGVTSSSKVAVVKVTDIKKVAFKTYKEASGKSSKMGNLMRGGLEKVVLNNVDDTRAFSGGSYSVVLILKSKKRIEFGFYLPKEKARLVKGFIEEKTQR